MDKKFRLRFDTPRIVNKGWGREVVIANNELYCGKILEFEEGAEFSSHFHLEKTETFFCLENSIELTFFDLTKGEEVITTLNEGESVQIFPGCPHRVRAKKGAKIIEVSTTHKDSDSYRIKPGDSQKNA